MPAAESEASRHAIAGLLAKGKVSLPVAASVPAHGRDEMLFNCPKRFPRRQDLPVIASP
jgi:hypothetical protein